MNKERYHLLDMLRGICIILVVVYHTLYNLSELFGGEYAFFRSDGMETFRAGFVNVLIVLAGISCNLTRSNLKRGIETLAAAILVTIVTSIAFPEETIIFGVLHFFGCSMLLYALLDKLLRHVPTLLGAFACLVVYVLTQSVYENSPAVPRSFLLYALGFRTGHSSGDYYPMLPWFFLFLFCAFVGRYFKERRVPKLFCSNPIPALSFVGRHTLIIYLLHQPIIYGTLYLYFNYIK